MLLIFPCVKLHCSISGLLSDLIQLSPANQELQDPNLGRRICSNKEHVYVCRRNSQDMIPLQKIYNAVSRIGKINRIRAVLRVTAQLPVCGLGFGT